MKDYILKITIVILTILLLVRTCAFHKSHDNANTVTLNDTIKYFKNKLGTQTASIQTLKVSKKQLQNLVLTKDEKLVLLTKEFSKLKTVVKYKTVMRFDTIRMAYKDSVQYIFERIGRKNTEWYSFNYKSNQLGVEIDSFKAHTETSVITGFKRKWLLGSQTLTTDVINSNPYVKVTQFKAAEVVVPESWYRKWYIWLALGISGGWFVAQ